MKVALVIERAPRGSFNPLCTAIPLKQSLPFYECESGVYTHRVRSMRAHFFNEKFQHTSVVFWCGAHGSIRTDGARRRGRSPTCLRAEPSDRPICATCEGRATGAGQLGSREIAGHEVRYSPRPGLPS